MAVMLCGAAVAGCSDSSEAGARASRAATDAVRSMQPGGSSSDAPNSSSAAPNSSSEPDFSGRVVVLDPGHNGGNGAHPAQINRQVPDGAGGTKACNTAGTQTDAGYAEHAFTWDVAQRIAPTLRSRGITVTMTRATDDGVGPCVDERARVGNRGRADAVVSIHADGAGATSRGFYCMINPQAQAASAPARTGSRRLATDVAAGLKRVGPLPPANYAGTTTGVTQGRRDLAGLNLSAVPTTMCELGNMRSSQDAAVQSSSAGRQQLADGIATGLLTYLTATPTAGRSGG